MLFIGLLLLGAVSVTSTWTGRVFPSQECPGRQGKGVMLAFHFFPAYKTRRKGVVGVRLSTPATSSSVVLRMIRTAGGVAGGGSEPGRKNLSSADGGNNNNNVFSGFLSSIFEMTSSPSPSSAPAAALLHVKEETEETEEDRRMLSISSLNVFQTLKSPSPASSPRDSVTALPSSVVASPVVMQRDEDQQSDREGEVSSSPPAHSSRFPTSEEHVAVVVQEEQKEVVVAVESLVQEEEKEQGTASSSKNDNDEALRERHEEPLFPSTIMKETWNEQEQVLRRYKLRAVVLQDELVRTRKMMDQQSLLCQEAKKEALKWRLAVKEKEEEMSQSRKSREVERKGYEGVISTITLECERLQDTLGAREEELAAATEKVAKWKMRYRADVKKLNEEILELDEVLYGMEKEVEGSQAVWAATEMKYKRQLNAMRKRNIELTEKLKEISLMEAESLEVVDRLKRQLASLSRYQQQTAAVAAQRRKMKKEEQVVESSSSSPSSLVTNGEEEEEEGLDGAKEPMANGIIADEQAEKREARDDVPSNGDHLGRIQQGGGDENALPNTNTDGLTPGSLSSSGEEREKREGDRGIVYAPVVETTPNKRGKGQKLKQFVQKSFPFLINSEERKEDKDDWR